MKTVFITLGLAALLAGCASHENDMGGTSDSYSASPGQNSNKASDKPESSTTLTNNYNYDVRPQP